MHTPAREEGPGAHEGLHNTGEVHSFGKLTIEMSASWNPAARCQFQTRCDSGNECDPVVAVSIMGSVFSYGTALKESSLG